MKRLQYYLEKISNFIRRWKDYLPIINITLFGTVLILIGITLILLFLPVSTPKVERDERRGQKRFEDIALFSQKGVKPSINEFDSIYNSNPFDPGRTDWVVLSTATQPTPTPPLSLPEKVEEKVVEERPKPRPNVPVERIKLYGILMFGETRMALIENVDKPGKGDKKFIYIKEGEDIAGYTVKAIEQDKLTIEWDNEESEITLHKRIKDIK